VIFLHIPENYLSPSTCAVMGAVMLPVWRMALQKVKAEIPKEQLPLLGIGAAFSFLSMMFNVPLPGGTTGHAVGGTLLAVLFGPGAACLAITVALFIQAVFFGDGGILAFGANCFNMAFVLPFTGYFVYKQIKKRVSSERGEYLAIAIGSYIGINAAAFCAAVEFGIQPIFFHNAAGQAIYCPYTLSISIPAMMIGHLTLFGLAEVVFTTAIYGYLKKTSAGLFLEHKGKGNFSLYGLLTVLILATPIGLLADGTAWGEWAPEEIVKVAHNGANLGYIPSGLENGSSFEAFFPDYTVGTLPDLFGYILSAVIGTALLIIIFKVLSSFVKDKVNYGKSSGGV